MQGPHVMQGLCLSAPPRRCVMAVTESPPAPILSWIRYRQAAFEHVQQVKCRKQGHNLFCGDEPTRAAACPSVHVGLQSNQPQCTSPTLAAGSLLLSASADKSVLAVDAATGKASARREAAHASGINRLLPVSDDTFATGKARRVSLSHTLFDQVLWQLLCLEVATSQTAS